MNGAPTSRRGTNMTSRRPREPRPDHSLRFSSSSPTRGIRDDLRRLVRLVNLGNADGTDAPSCGARRGAQDANELPALIGLPIGSGVIETPADRSSATDGTMNDDPDGICSDLPVVDAGHR